VSPQRKDNRGERRGSTTVAAETPRPSRAPRAVGRLGRSTKAMKQSGVAFFAEFDDLKGPTIVFDEPSGFFECDEGKRLWDNYCDYVLSGNSLLDGKVVSVSAGGDSVLCLPVMIHDDKKYHRNSLLFCLGVFVPTIALAATNEACRAALIRLARALRAMELENSVLSQSEGRPARLAAILPGVLGMLRNAAACAAGDFAGDFPDPELDALPRPKSGRKDDLDDDANVLCLRRPWLRNRAVPREPPPAVRHWQVPVLLARPRELLALSTTKGKSGLEGRSTTADGEWDLAVQQVIPHVDGVRNARQLARAAHVDVAVVTRSLRVLCNFGCLTVIDTFQYSNMYRTTAKLAELARSRSALDACARFVLRCPEGDVDIPQRAETDAEGRARPPAERTAVGVLRLYAAFADGARVRDVLAAGAATCAPLVDALDHRAFAAFGVIHGLLRRVHRYPLAVRDADSPPPDAARRPPNAKTQRALQLANGQHCMDEICSELDLPVTKVDRLWRAAGAKTLDVYKCMP